jgi:hypothetical protein
MENTGQFYDSWNMYMFYGILGSIGIGALILLYYEFRVLRIKEYKEKYDFVNLHEVKYFWYAVIAFLLAAAFAVNTLGTEVIRENGVRWFYVRVFISLCSMVIGYFLFYSMIRVYYPKKIAKRLNKLRTAPRISPDGNVMRRLTEEEEDVHLEKSMIEEEEIQVVDYDVWIDEKTGYKKIEKYIINEQTTECPECGYYTLMIDREEVGQAPTESEAGYIIEHLKCSYCGYKEKREVMVSSLASNVA